MHKKMAVAWVLGILVVAAFGATAKPGSKTENGQAIVIVFKDGTKQSFAMGDIARIEFKGAAASTAVNASTNAPSSSADEAVRQNHFLGKWRVGDGSGGNFFITLESSGEAKKSIGAIHGTWTVVNNEARITWDDGWHDAIRKVGTKHEKFAYAPEKTFSDKPDNVTNAQNLETRPI